MTSPIALEIPWIDPPLAWEQFARKQGTVFLDSNMAGNPQNQYSFIAEDPFLTLTCKDNLIQLNGETQTGNPFDTLQKLLKRFALTKVPHLPPFQGGAAGWFGFELFQHLENLAPPDDLPLPFPDMALGFYDRVIAFDHHQKKTWIFSSGFPHKDELTRSTHAQNRCDDLLQQLHAAQNKRHHIADPDTYLRPEQLSSNFTRDAYLSAVLKAKDFIAAGDIFEACISQRFSASLPPHFNPIALYHRLRSENPAPFSAWMHFGETILASASPERFLQLSDRCVEARPIKGTRPRGTTHETDRQFAEALQTSEKDRAENVMIVDLLRNDLSKVCNDASVTVPVLCGLESYSVHHLVSVICGTLRPGLSAVDLLMACFPGGSITGAPKIRAIDIISAIEKTPRGPYCGSHGWLGFDGNMDLAITIRTLCIHHDALSFQVGGAIVYDSDPEDEYLETLAKASGLMRALCGTANT